MYRHKTRIAYIGIYLLAISTAFRGLDQYLGESSQWSVIGLLALYFILMLIEPWLSSRSRLYTHIYLGVQTAVVALFLTIPPNTNTAWDYFAVLCIPLAVQAMHRFSTPTGFRWIGVFSVAIAVTMILKFGIDNSLSFAITYPVTYIFIGAFWAIIRQAENARVESQRLLAELQTAHEKLQIYTAQAEDLAAMEERNRLARDLHDSVTQTIFSITLNAQAAQMLLERDPLPCDELATQVKRLQEQSQSALVEMRSLIYQLRPTSVAEEGLIPALQKHIAGLQRRAKVRVDLQTTGDQLPLDTNQQQELFRIIQEALNNVSKHAQTDHAQVTFKTEGANFSATIADHGRGFDMAEQTKSQSGFGLRSMRERATKLGGTIDIVSNVQGGTQVHVSVPILKEQSRDG